MRNRKWHSIPEYQALRAILQSGTATGAARQLDVSQSAISRAVANLEDRLGTALFEREAGRLRPTHEAVRLNRRLDPLFDALDRIDGPTISVQETLRLITPPTYGHRFILKQINSFSKVNPNSLVSLEINTSDEVLRAVTEDRFDLGLTGVEQTRVGVKFLPYRLSRAVCVMPLDHPLATRASLTPSDLNGQDLIALTHRHARRGQLDRLLHRAGSEPNIRAEVSTSHAAADLAGEGLGIAVVNSFPIYVHRSEDLAFVPFDSPLQYRNQFVVSDHRPVPRIARAFMRYLRLNTAADPFSSKQA